MRTTCQVYWEHPMLEKIFDWLPEQQDNKPNKFTIYMGNSLKQAREEAGLSQADLAPKIYRRRATLSDIETGKADVDAGTLWLLSAILKKPLSYFYPPYARENMTPEEMGALEHELLMHFIAIRGEELQKLAIDLVKVIEKFDPLELVINQTPNIQERLRRRENDVPSSDEAEE